MTARIGVRGVEPGARIRRVVLAVLLLSGAMGCASEPWKGSDDGPMGPLLPRPFGSVSVDRQPIAWAFEWTGILGGLAFAGVGLSGPHDWSGPAVVPGAVFLTLGAGFLGGVAMALPGHLLQWLWDTIVGGPGEGDPEVQPEGGTLR